ncbi:MAG TPA: transporter associated domain-containing protein [Thermoanaerobaculia bacterium]|nr:transporter associated domain-containing protein [Thermoanaerobaculia bacterium]
MIGRAGGLPRLGDVIRVGDYQFEIIDVDGRRLDRIIVSRLPGIPI